MIKLQNLLSLLTRATNQLHLWRSVGIHLFLSKSIFVFARLEKV